MPSAETLINILQWWVSLPEVMKATVVTPAGLRMPFDKMLQGNALEQFPAGVSHRLFIELCTGFKGGLSCKKAERDKTTPKTTSLLCFKYMSITTRIHRRRECRVR